MRARWWLGLVSVLGLWGCTRATPGPDAWRMPLALTQQAYVQSVRLTQTARAPGPSGTATIAPREGFAPVTATPRGAVLPPLVVSPTAAPDTPAPVTATVLGRLNCRAGPALYYPVQRVLQPGERVQVIGEHPVYYVFRLVRLDSGETCWASVRWLQLEESEITLPRVTPPPPPAGAFTLPRQHPLMVPLCPIFWTPALLVQIRNVGPAPIRSFEGTLEVLPADAVYRTRIREGIPTCEKVRTQLPPGERVTLALRAREDLTGRRVRIWLRACTRPEFQGACVAYAVVWTIEPPPPLPPLPFGP